MAVKKSPGAAGPKTKAPAAGKPVARSGTRAALGGSMKTTAAKAKAPAKRKRGTS